MIDRLEYRGLTGTVEYCNEDNIYHGKVIGLPGVLITYHGEDLDSLMTDFYEAVDFYLLPSLDDTTPYKIAL